MTPLNLDELEKLLAEATPWPWEAIPQNRAGPIIGHRFPTGLPAHPGGVRIIGHLYAREGSVLEDEANAGLLVVAVNALPDLIAAARERDRLTAENERLRDIAEELMGLCERNLATAFPTVVKAHRWWKEKK